MLGVLLVALPSAIGFLSGSDVDQTLSLTLSIAGIIVTVIGMVIYQLGSRARFLRRRLPECLLPYERVTSPPMPGDQLGRRCIGRQTSKHVSPGRDRTLIRPR